ncbi:hypothetical protein BD770DRAFT_447374 [Pilaira anomala]|nr:hypothetical protein BD770DRAFT_447374 [Pilaira anomala]
MDSPTTSVPQGVGLFNGNGNIRSSWIAFFTLWVLWGLSYFLRHITDYNKDIHRDNNHTPEMEEGTGGKKGWKNMNNSLADRLRRSHEVLFENTLLLLSVLTLNTLAGGVTRAVVILCWIFFAFTLIHALTEVGYHNNFIRMVFNLIFYGITLAIGALAFANT